MFVNGWLIVNFNSNVKREFPIPPQGGYEFLTKKINRPLVRQYQQSFFS